jgi:hypothetical protein
VLEKQSYRVSGLGRVVGRAVEMIMGGREQSLSTSMYGFPRAKLRYIVVLAHISLTLQLRAL